MKITGLITEYNPFHNGHAYHIEEAKRLTGADAVIAVMSGDFVQRGAPAIFDKYTRTEMALLGGVDLILEIPALFAVGSAEDFASAAIALLDKLGVVNAICFGSECGDIASLMQIAAVLLEEPEDYSTQLKAGLKNGLSFPEARNLALLFCSRLSLERNRLNEILTSPNNILGIEYCKALLKQRSTITPFTLKRIGGYHEKELSPSFSSASAIRQMITTADSAESVQLLSRQIPPQVWQMLASSQKAHPICLNDFSGLLNYSILTKLSQGESLTTYADMSKELEARLKKNALSYATFEDRIQQLKTKQYTYTRISRALLHLILNIKESEIVHFRISGYIQYARVLGFRESAKPILTQIKIKGKIPLLTKTANAERILSEDAQAMFQRDSYSSHVYQTVCSVKYEICPLNEFTQPITIL